MSNNFIVNTPLDKLRIVSFQGMTIYNCHKQIQEVLKKQLKDENANVFAEPVFDETDGSIDWYTSLNGKARPFASLSAEEQAELKSRFQALAGEIDSLAKKILADSKEGSSVKGNILQKAMVWPLAPEPDACLYSVGGHPVLICWGFMDGTGKTVSKEDIDRDDLGRKRPTVTEFVQKAAPAAAAVPKPEEPVPPAAEPEKPAEEKKEEKTRARAFPWWLLPLLLLLLLFLLLYYFLLPRYPLTDLSGCTRHVEPIDPRPIPVPPVPDPPIVPVPWAKGKLLIDGDFVDDHNVPVTLVVSGSVVDLQKGVLKGEIKGKSKGFPVCEGEGKFSITADSGYELDFADGIACSNKDDFVPFRLHCNSTLQNCYVCGKKDEHWPVRVKLVND